MISREQANQMATEIMSVMHKVVEQHGSNIAYVILILETMAQLAGNKVSLTMSRNNYCLHFTGHGTIPETKIENPSLAAVFKEVAKTLESLGVQGIVDARMNPSCN